MQGKNGEKRDDKEHHEKTSVFHLAEFENGTVVFVLFLRKRLLHFL